MADAELKQKIEELIAANPVLLDAAQSGEGLGHHARVEMHVVGRLHVGGRARNVGLDAGFDVVGCGHPRDPRVAAAILCEV